MDTLEILKLKDSAVIPTRASSMSAGLDLFACLEKPLELNPNQRTLVPTGIAIKLPENTAGLVYARSGLSTKHGIHLTNGVGVIDADYRGELKIAVHNLSENSYTINPNDRIAQLVVTPILFPEILEVTNLDETDRGTGGFGSTSR